MRKLFTLLLSMLLTGFAYGQGRTQSVFVMVDLSSNIKGHPDPITREMREDAIAFTRSLITASYRPADFPNWEQTGVPLDPEIDNIVKGKSKPLIGADDFLMIMPFGESATINRFKINEIKTYPSDFDRYYQFPFNYTDRDTWGDYAEAKICNIAYNYQISEYYLFRIQGKPDDPNSSYLTSDQSKMIDDYVTGSVAQVVGKFRHKMVNFSVTIKKVDISKIPGMKNYKKTAITSSNTDRKSIRIISPKGEKKHPYKAKSDRISVTWVCIGCDSTATYSLTVRNLDTKKTKKHKVINANYKSISMGPGKYKINVSSFGIRSKTEYVKIPGEGGGFGGLILILILAAAGYFGYKFFMDKRKQKHKPKPDDSWTDDNATAPPGWNDPPTDNDF